MLKEHDCVGNDLNADLVEYDAGCTPDGSMIMPGPVFDKGNFYGIEDSDDFLFEGFRHEGCAFELYNPDENDPLAPTGIFHTCPTVISQGHKAVGGRATFDYDIGIKAESITSPIEVTCSVCAARPQSAGPGQTFAHIFRKHEPHDGEYGENCKPGTFCGDSPFFGQLNRPQKPWKISARHLCGPRHLDCNPGDEIDMNVVTIPSLFMGDARKEKAQYATFIGCKPTTVILDNDTLFRRGDLINVRVDVPATARVAATMDVTSCEISYIRSCNGEEGFFKDICRGEP
jgi:hypothetical protein